MNKTHSIAERGGPGAITGTILSTDGECSGCSDGDEAAVFSGFSPSVNRSPAMTSGSKLAPFSARHVRAADSHSLNTIAGHALRPRAVSC